MKVLLSCVILFAILLSAGCGGKEEPREEKNPSLPPADSMFDKSNTPRLKGDPANKKEKANPG